MFKGLTLSKEYFLVQKVAANENDVLMEHVHSCAYIETASMEGVKLILELVDHAAQYRDDYEIGKGATLDVTFSDPDGRGDEVWIERFVVVKANIENGLLVVNAFSEATHDLKQPTITPRFFNRMQPSDILKELLPNLKVVADSFKSGATYHLNAGGTKARLLRSMARDYGALCFVCRGTVYFKALSSLPHVAEFELENGNPQADYSIARYSIIGEQALYERMLDKTYFSWDTVEGVQHAKSGSNGATTLVSVPQGKALNNQHKALIPLLEVELGGNSKYMPSACCSVIFHKQYPANELDETLPEIQYINQVTHYQRGNRYLCQLELGEPHQ